MIRDLGSAGPLAVLLLCLACAPGSAAPRIAVIVDDLGHDLALGRRTADLPGPVACAVLPHTPYGARLAERAHDNGKEVILHLPMQATELELPLGPGGLYLDDTRARFASTVHAALSSVPHVVGVNNHMGSLLTRHPGHMQWLMEELEPRALYFVDSRTTHHTVARLIADERGLPALQRDVFLDRDPSPEGVARELERLKRVASARGRAVAIGHPYPVTLEALERALPELEAAGFELVPPSALLEKEAPAWPVYSSP
jgi:hypothetical protein